MAFSKTYNETNPVFHGDALSTPGTVTVTPDGLVLNDGGVALNLSGGSYTVKVDGIIGCPLNSGLGGVGLYLTAAAGASSTVKIGATGTVFSKITPAIASYQGLNLSNAGTVSGALGVWSSHSDSVSDVISNTGVIKGQDFAVYVLNQASATLKNSGLIEDDVKLGALGSGMVSATLTNAGVINGTVDLNALKNVFSNTGTVSFLQVGGASQIKNSGTITSGVFGSDMIDKLTNTGVIDGVGLAGGADTLTNSGTILNDVYMQNGNDVLSNSGSIKGNIYLGAGNDIFNGGKTAEKIWDEAGADKYSFGDGLDIYFISDFTLNEIGDGQANTVDGGTNKGVNPALGLFGDTITAEGSISDFTFNLDSKLQTDIFGNSVEAGFAGNSSIGFVNSIKGFEVAIGGNGADRMFGNSAANLFEGRDGADQFYGGAGNDTIKGGNGSDIIFGDAGADRLSGANGGAGDLATDFFNYRALTDSTVAITGRDVILDFEDNFDQIDMRHLTDATHQLVQGITFAGVDVAFTTGPSLRVITTDQGWTIQLDANGDHKVDMAIDVADATHAIVWDSGDFVFP